MEKLKLKKTLDGQTAEQRPKRPARNIKLVFAAASGLAALIASPGQFFKDGAPIPLAFTMR